MSISASVGEQWRQRFCQRCGAGLRLAPPKTGQPDKSQATGLPLASKQTQCEAWDAKTLCWDAKILDHTCSHAVEFPIRLAYTEQKLALWQPFRYGGHL